MYQLPPSQSALMDSFAVNKHSDMKSQKAQDFWVSTILRGKKNGYFLDLAAADGIEHSNTFYLEKFLSWTGLLIEPNERFFEKLVKNRTSRAVKEVVSDKNHRVEFRTDNGQLGGIVADDTDNSLRVRSAEIADASIQTVNAKTINEILANENAPHYIDYFSLDIEGSEERIIRTLDFQTYKFGLITIERANPAVNQILKNNDYQFVRNCRFDTFYAHSSLIQAYDIPLEPFDQVPEKNW